MQKIFYNKPYNLLLLIILLCLSCCVFDCFNHDNFTNLKQARSIISFYTGAICYILASIIIFMATRNKLLSFLGAQDKIYRFHKILGIFCVIFAALHMYTSDIVKNIMPLFYEFDTLSGASEITMPKAMYDFAKDLGEYVIYIGAFLFIITFINKIAYKTWYKFHKLFAVLYLVLLVHLYYLTPADKFLTPIGMLLVFCSAIGSIGAIVTLCSQTGFIRKFKANVQEFYKDGNILYLTLKPNKNVQAKDGSFFFLKFGKHNYHPFSFTGFDKNNNLTFAIKKFGSFTSELFDKIDNLQELSLEGPYGNMHIQEPKDGEKYLYIANGIGLTPFLKFLTDLLNNKEINGEVFFFIMIKNIKDPLVKDLMDKIENFKGKNVHIRVYQSDIEPKLKFDDFVQITQNMDKVYFCGSKKLGSDIKKAFLKDHKNELDFHQEYTLWR